MFSYYPLGVLTLIWAFNSCLLFCTWLWCIRSFTKDTSHGFLVSRSIIHSRFMNLGNLVETIIHHLLIGGMICFGHQDGFLMVNTLVYVMHIGQDLWRIRCKVINFHDSPSYCSVRTLNLKKILSLYQNQLEALTHGWDPKVVIYPYGLGHCWWRPIVIGILNKGTMISHGIEIMCPLGWSKWHVIMKFVAIIIHLVEFNISSLKLEYVNWSHNKWNL